MEALLGRREAQQAYTLRQTPAPEQSDQKSLTDFMTKRARPHFGCLQYESGQPWILMEYFDGDSLDLFQKTIGFDLPKDTLR
jgi:hypothetical protein